MCITYQSEGNTAGIAQETLEGEGGIGLFGMNTDIA